MKSLNVYIIQKQINNNLFHGNKSVTPNDEDIEVFKNSNKGINEKSVWTTINKMRELKNRIFFEMITEKTVRLYI